MIELSISARKLIQKQHPSFCTSSSKSIWHAFRLLSSSPSFAIKYFLVWHKKVTICAIRLWRAHSHQFHGYHQPQITMEKRMRSDFRPTNDRRTSSFTLIMLVISVNHIHWPTNKSNIISKINNYNLTLVYKKRLREIILKENKMSVCHTDSFVQTNISRYHFCRLCACVCLTLGGLFRCTMSPHLIPKVKSKKWRQRDEKAAP